MNESKEGDVDDEWQETVVAKMGACHELNTLNYCILKVFHYYLLTKNLDKQLLFKTLSLELHSV